MSETCGSCVHYQAMHMVCGALQGHLWCPACCQPFLYDSGKKPTTCPKCDACGTARAVEDVSEGKPKYCPGWEQKPETQPRPTQMGLF